MKRIELKVVIEVPDRDGSWTPGECGEHMIKYLEGNTSPDEWKLISLDSKAVATKKGPEPKALPVAIEVNAAIKSADAETRYNKAKQLLRAHARGKTRWAEKRANGWRIKVSGIKVGTPLFKAIKSIADRVELPSVTGRHTYFGKCPRFFFDRAKQRRTLNQEDGAPLVYLDSISE